MQGTQPTESATLRSSTRTETERSPKRKSVQPACRVESAGSRSSTQVLTASSPERSDEGVVPVNDPRWINPATHPRSPDHGRENELLSANPSSRPQAAAKPRSVPFLKSLERLSANTGEPLDRSRAATAHQSPLRRGQRIPAPTHAQPGRLVSVGTRGARSRRRRRTNRCSSPSATARVTGAT